MTKGKGKHRTVALACGRMGFALVCTGISLQAGAQSLSDSLASMVSGGTTHLALRYRLEDVEQDNLLKDATASTLRTRLSFASATVNRFSLALEADAIVTLGTDSYDSFVPDRYRGRYSVIADPVGTEINVAALAWQMDENGSLSLGRQRLNHGTQRFLGSVGFRQNEQTMDALSYHRKSGSLTVDYSYLWNVNRVFGTSKKSVQAEDFDSNSHALLLASQQSFGTLGAYLYAFDFDNARTASSLTYGLSYTGTVHGLSLYASVAQQQDYGDNPFSYDADYITLEGSGKVGDITLLLGYENLGSDGALGFSTPLATLHKFQGFADTFLNTPAKGLEDVYVTASTALNQWTLALSFHDFSASKGSQSWGSEWDAVAGYKVNNALNVEAKFARYSRDNFGVDTDKLWLTVNMVF